MKLDGFGQQTGQLRNTGSHIEAPPATRQFSQECPGQIDAQPLAGPSLRPPELIAPFVAIDGAEGSVIEVIENLGDETPRRAVDGFPWHEQYLACLSQSSTEV